MCDLSRLFNKYSTLPSSKGMEARDGAVWVKFVLGAVSCSAPLPIMNPIEVVKTRLQLQGEMQEERRQSAADRLYGEQRKYKGMLRGAIQIVKDEGILGLYKGIVPAGLRESSYAAIRLALYDPFKMLLGENKSLNRELSFPRKILAGAVAGSIGAAIANPTDVLKVRMQAASGVVYRNTWHGFVTILSTEGVAGLYKGVVATTQRACILSAAMLPSYDHSKHYILSKGWIKSDSVSAHVCSGMISGFCMSVVSSPIDVAKTRIMNSRDAVGKTYSGVFDCLFKTLRKEGILGVYKGFIPTFLRLGPHTIMAMTIYEALRNWAGIDPV